MNHPHNSKNILLHNYFPIIVLLGINFLVGVFVYSDYGESWDEHLRYRYAENSLNAYRGIPGDTTDEKGPFFVMIATLGGKLICTFQDDCLLSDARHFINFTSFLMGLFFLYRINLKLFTKWAAFGGTLLFNTQPLLWGHAFINPKDLPFMAFFIASIDTGFVMADSILTKKATNEIMDSNIPKRVLQTQFISEWKLISSAKRKVIIVAFISIIIFILGLFLSKNSVQIGLENLVKELLYNDTHSILKSVFNLIAPLNHELPAENYTHKAWQLYVRFSSYLIISLVFLWILATAFLLPKTRNLIWHTHLKPFIRNIREYLKNPALIIAGIFLGLACSIRTLGPAAGGLICLYLILTYKKHAIPIIIAYSMTGALITYIAWPGLWGSPLQNFLDSLSLASNFPWEGKVLFGGNYYTPGTHPRSYIPALLFTQFTLSGIFTFLFGLIISIPIVIYRKAEWIKLCVIFSWFFIPIILIIIIEPSIYDNFRHFLFIIPPLFIIASFTLEWILIKVKRPIIKSIFIFLLIMPNIFTLIRLHPYQYVYYNLFTNGIGGAFRTYEMDYWATSYREATEFINRNAPKNSQIIVLGAPHLVNTYARSDFEILKYKSGMILDPERPTYAIILSRYDKDNYLFPESEYIYAVERDGAIFSVVKYLNDELFIEP